MKKKDKNKPDKPKKEKKDKLSPEDKKRLFKDAQKVKDLKAVDSPVKGQLFKMKHDSKKGNKRSTVFRATGKQGFGKFEVVTSKKASKIPFRD